MPNKKLILLVNLGSPQELSVTAIRNFLRQFLSDKRVVGLSRWLWLPILYGIILPLRAKKLLHKYQMVWHSSNCAPLNYYTQSQAQLLTATVSSDDSLIVDYAYCYGEKSIAATLIDAHKNNFISELRVIPLYPQFSSTTTAPVFDQISEFYRQANYIPKINFINSFATHPSYINALADSIRQNWLEYGRADKLILSFHSLPQKLIDNGDTYQAECHATYLALCSKLEIIPGIDAKICFQSKFGKGEWIGPATDNLLIELANDKIKTLDVICPGFVCDCLETLEEVALQYRDLFILHGGTELNYIPCLNDSAGMINLLNELS